MRYLITLLTLALSSYLSAQTHKGKIIPDSLLKDAGAVILSEESIFTLKDIRSATERVSKEILILNQKGEELSSIEIGEDKFRKLRSFSGEISINGKILKNESYQKMINYSVTNIHTLFNEKEIGYGYGLRINDKADFFEIGHTGFSPPAGFTAVNLYYPEKKVSVTVLENQATDDFDIAYYFEQEIRNLVIKSDLVK